jgi:hypothetical protein
MKAIIASLFIAATANAETLIFPVQDLLLEHPNFVAPDFSINSALNGQAVPGNPPKSVRESKKQIERKLIGIMWDEYPDALSIRIWNGNMIVRMP